MKALLKKAWTFLKFRLPLRNIILFESSPDYSDNSRAVFNEFLKRGLNKKYKLVWVTENGTPLPEELNIKNVYTVKRYYGAYNYFIYVAKCIITCNDFLAKPRKEQEYFYLSHGCALKDVKGHYCPPDDIGKIDCFTLSKFFIKREAQNLCINSEYYKALGFPRNDMLFHKADVHSLFENRNFSKVIYWMPTYRQHRFGLIHSNISIPVIHGEETARRINDCAAKNGVLIIVKPHPAQDVSKIKEYNLSNLVFINDDFLKQRGVDNYSLLGSCDALLTDYSSVYYDFLLCDKPIGLCWEDFEEYKRLEGFAIDTDTVMAGGEKIYTPSELCSFIEETAKGEDKLSMERKNVASFIHDFKDNNSAKRVADYIINKL